MPLLNCLVGIAADQIESLFCLFYSDDLRSPTASTSKPPLEQPSQATSPQNEEYVDVSGDLTEEMCAGFQRRNAKRGMSFKPREEVLPNAIQRSTKGKNNVLAAEIQCVLVLCDLVHRYTPFTIYGTAS